MTKRAAAIAAALLLGVAVMLAARRDNRPIAAKSADTSSLEVGPQPAPPSPAMPTVESPSRPVAPPAPSAAPPQEDEAALMRRLRRMLVEDPEVAIEVARAANARFPQSAGAPERASIVIHALAALGRPSEARGEAEQMVNEYPDSSWATEVEAFTGAHPHRDHF
jgi:hypothetical protein